MERDASTALARQGNNPMVTSWPGPYRMLSPEAVRATEHNQPLVNWHALQGPAGDGRRHRHRRRRVWRPATTICSPPRPQRSNPGAHPTAAGAVALAGSAQRGTGRRARPDRNPRRATQWSRRVFCRRRGDQLYADRGLQPCETHPLFARARVTAADERVFLDKLAALALTQRRRDRVGAAVRTRSRMSRAYRCWPPCSPTRSSCSIRCLHHSAFRRPAASAGRGAARTAAARRLLATTGCGICSITAISAPRSDTEFFGFDTRADR